MSIEWAKYTPFSPCTCRCSREDHGLNLNIQTIEIFLFFYFSSLIHCSYFPKTAKVRLYTTGARPRLVGDTTDMDILLNCLEDTAMEFR